MKAPVALSSPGRNHAEGAPPRVWGSGIPSKIASLTGRLNQANLALSVRFGFQRQPHPEQNVTTAPNLHPPPRQRLRQAPHPRIELSPNGNISPPETSFEEVFLALYPVLC